LLRNCAGPSQPVDLETAGLLREVAVDDYEKLIANLRRQRLDIERAAPAESADEIVKKLAELQRRIDKVQRPKEQRK
jgi:hypothetical protein